MSLDATDDRQEAVQPGPSPTTPTGGEDVETERQPKRHRRLPERVPHRVVVVRLRAGIPRHHHATKAGRFDRLEVGDPFLDGAQRGLTAPEEPIRSSGAVLGDPPVVGVEARSLVVDVRVAAQHHPHRRVQDLRSDPVAVLVGEPHGRVVTGLVELVELDTLLGQFPCRRAGGGDQPHRHRRLHTGQHEHVASYRILDHVRRCVAVRPVDVSRVAVRRESRTTCRSPLVCTDSTPSPYTTQ